MSLRQISIFLTGVGLIGPGSAFAQQLGPGSPIAIDPDLARADVAGRREDSEFRALPIPFGPFMASPSLSTVGELQSNVFNRPNERSSAVAIVTPRLVLNTDALKYALNLSATGRFRRFSETKTENSEEFELAAVGRFNIARTDTLLGSIEYGRLIEPRSSAASNLLTAEPINFDHFNAEVGTRLSMGKLRISPAVSLRKVNYATVNLTSGGSSSQAFRDLRTHSGKLGLDYVLSTSLAVFVEGAYGDVNSTSAPPAQLRDSRYVVSLVGLRGEISPVVQGEFALGYQSRNYRLARFKDFSGITYRGDVQWFITPLVTLRGQARQSFENSGVAQAAGILSNQFTISGYWDILRSVRLAATAGYEHNKFRDVSTRVNRGSFRLQAQYKLTRRIQFGVYASALRQDVKGLRILPDFMSFSGGIGVVLRP